MLVSVSSSYFDCCLEQVVNQPKGRPAMKGRTLAAGFGATVAAVVAVVVIVVVLSKADKDAVECW